jgi:hypothetical protein
VTIKTSGTTTIDNKGAVSENNQNNVTVVTSGTTTETKKGDVVETNLSSKTENTSGNSAVNVGGNLTENVTGNTDVTVSGTTTIKTEDGTTIQTTNGNTNIDTTGNTTISSTGNTTIQSTASGSNVNIYAGSAATATISAKTVSIIGSNASTVKAPTNTISGTTTNIYGNTNLNATGATVTVSGSSASTLKAPTTTVSGATTNIYGATTLTMTGATVNTTGTTVNISGGTGGVNITGATKVNGTFSASTSVTTPLVSATTISADTIHTKNGLEHSISWSYGSVTDADGSSYNGKEAKSFVIPKTISDVAQGKVSSDASGNLNVDGKIIAAGSIHSSDRDLKENIEFVAREDFNKAKNVAIKSFNFKDDENKNKMYGVIAQETQEAGLNELVYKKEDGHLAVDYTSLMILKIAYLEDFCAHLNGKIVELEYKLAKLENKD